MACGSCGGGSAESQPAVERQYEVTYPNGSQLVVQGEQAAKIEKTMNPGATYRKL
jgi:hypothetical protein